MKPNSINTSPPPFTEPPTTRHRPSGSPVSPPNPPKIFQRHKKSNKPPPKFKEHRSKTSERPTLTATDRDRDISPHHSKKPKSTSEIYGTLKLTKSNSTNTSQTHNQKNLIQSVSLSSQQLVDINDDSKLDANEFLSPILDRHSMQSQSASNANTNLPPTPPMPPNMESFSTNNNNNNGTNSNVSAFHEALIFHDIETYTVTFEKRVCGIELLPFDDDGNLGAIVKKCHTDFAKKNVIPQSLIVSINGAMCVHTDYDALLQHISSSPRPLKLTFHPPTDDNETHSVIQEISMQTEQQIKNELDIQLRPSVTMRLADDDNDNHVAQELFDFIDPKTLFNTNGNNNKNDKKRRNGKKYSDNVMTFDINLIQKSYTILYQKYCELLEFQQMTKTAMQEKVLEIKRLHKENKNLRAMLNLNSDNKKEQEMLNKYVKMNHKLKTKNAAFEQQIDTLQENLEQSQKEIHHLKRQRSNGKSAKNNNNHRNSNKINVSFESMTQSQTRNRFASNGTDYSDVSNVTVTADSKQSYVPNPPIPPPVPPQISGNNSNDNNHGKSPVLKPKVGKLSDKQLDLFKNLNLNNSQGFNHSTNAYYSHKKSDSNNSNSINDVSAQISRSNAMNTFSPKENPPKALRTQIGPSKPAKAAKRPSKLGSIFDFKLFTKKKSKPPAMSAHYHPQIQKLVAEVKERNNKIYAANNPGVPVPPRKSLSRVRSASLEAKGDRVRKDTFV